MILAILFSWAVVVADCEDAAETVSRYELAVARRDLLRWAPCPTEEDPEGLCPVYSAFAPIRVGEVPHPVGATAETRLESPIPDCEPGLGGACYWIVTAVDIFGHKSGEPCP